MTASFTAACRLVELDAFLNETMCYDVSFFSGAWCNNTEDFENDGDSDACACISPPLNHIQQWRYND